MVALMVAGVLFEIAGLALAARGLWVTWRDLSRGQPFLGPRMTAAVQWLRQKILRRPAPAASGSARSTLPGFESVATGYALEPVNDEMALDEKLDVLARNTRHAMETASRALHQATLAERRFQKMPEEWRAATEAAKMSAILHGEDQMVRGIPNAAFGLGAATIGLILQAVASLA